LTDIYAYLQPIIAISADGLSNWSKPSRQLWPFGEHRERAKPPSGAKLVMKKQIITKILAIFLQTNCHAVCLLLPISPILSKLHGERYAASQGAGHGRQT
jgi:hypothetical protein